MVENGHGKNGFDEVEQELKIKGIRISHAIARDQKKWRRGLLKANVRTGFSVWKEGLPKQRKNLKFQLR